MTLAPGDSALRLVLASRSPRRRDLLREAGIEAECDPADVEEVVAWDGAPRGLAEWNAELKARAVAARRPEDLVLGADTIVVFEGEIFGKPVDLDDAFRMLQRMVGRAHEVITGVVLLAPGRRMAFSETTRVRFRPLTDEQIHRYLARIEPLDKAGAYAAQEDDGELIETVEGCFANVVGLPIPRMIAALERFADSA